MQSRKETQWGSTNEVFKSPLTHLLLLSQLVLHVCLGVAGADVLNLQPIPVHCVIYVSFI